MWADGTAGRDPGPPASPTELTAALEAQHYRYREMHDSQAARRILSALVLAAFKGESMPEDQMRAAWVAINRLRPRSIQLFWQVADRIETGIPAAPFILQLMPEQKAHARTDVDITIKDWQIVVKKAIELTGVTFVELLSDGELKWIWDNAAEEQLQVAASQVAIICDAPAHPIDLSVIMAKVNAPRGKARDRIAALRPIQPLTAPRSNRTILEQLPTDILRALTTAPSRDESLERRRWLKPHLEAMRRWQLLLWSVHTEDVLEAPSEATLPPEELNVLYAMWEDPTMRIENTPSAELHEKFAKVFQGYLRHCVDPQYAINIKKRFPDPDFEEDKIKRELEQKAAARRITPSTSLTAEAPSSSRLEDTLPETIKLQIAQAVGDSPVKITQLGTDIHIHSLVDGYSQLAEQVLGFHICSLVAKSESVLGATPLSLLYRADDKDSLRLALEANEHSITPPLAKLWIDQYKPVIQQTSTNIAEALAICYVSAAISCLDSALTKATDWAQRDARYSPKILSLKPFTIAEIGTLSRNGVAVLSMKAFAGYFILARRGLFQPGCKSEAIPVSWRGENIRKADLKQLKSMSLKHPSEIFKWKAHVIKCMSVFGRMSNPDLAQELIPLVEVLEASHALQTHTVPDAPELGVVPIQIPETILRVVASACIADSAFIQAAVDLQQPQMCAFVPGRMTFAKFTDYFLCLASLAQMTSRMAKMTLFNAYKKAAVHYCPSLAMSAISVPNGDILALRRQFDKQVNEQNIIEVDGTVKPQAEATAKRMEDNMSLFAGMLAPHVIDPSTLASTSAAVIMASDRVQIGPQFCATCGSAHVQGKCPAAAPPPPPTNATLQGVKAIQQPQQQGQQQQQQQGKKRKFQGRQNGKPSKFQHAASSSTQAAPTSSPAPAAGQFAPVLAALQTLTSQLALQQAPPQQQSQQATQQKGTTSTSSQPAGVTIPPAPGSKPVDNSYAGTWTAICRDFRLNRCHRGYRCRFVHTDIPLKPEFIHGDFGPTDPNAIQH